MSRPVSLPLACLGLACLMLAACAVAPAPGTVEHAAATVSRAYDCGLRVERARVMAGLGREQRAAFLAANAGYAVSSYKAPHPCGPAERERVSGELKALTRR